MIDSAVDRWKRRGIADYVSPWENGVNVRSEAVGRYPDEMRQRAVRMLFEHHGEYPSLSKEIKSIAKRLNLDHEMLRICVRKGRKAVAINRPV